jgi:very-short-patch-repair endonuclease/predicted transcriptional regulator of viral defense system
MRGSFVNRWAEAAEIAGRQHGVVTLAQVVALGAGDDAVHHAARNGRLHRLHRGVYAVGHVPITREARWMAAVLACGPGAVLSHANAAALWGIRDKEPHRPHVTIPPGSGRRRPDIHLHRCALEPEEATAHRGIPVTTVARLLVDLARDLDHAELTRTLREARFRRLVHLPALQRALARKPSPALTALIEDEADTRSHLEDAFLRLLDAHGLPRPVGQHPINGHAVDFLWPEQRVVVETDGWEGHRHYAAFELDRELTNAMQLQGYVVLRLTPSAVTRRPARTARMIARALG